MAEQLQKVRHDYLRYANCWEDADILLEGLDIQPGDRVLSIGSAGDNSFSLLVNDPEVVVAVDINSVQLNLIELKKAAFLELDYDTFLQFLGFRASNDRKIIFARVKKHLSQDVISFWETCMDDIEAGIIHQGKFEKYFKLFLTRILPLIHSRKKIIELLAEKNGEQQANFYQTKWNNVRWRILFKVFFSKFLMGKIGRDPAFLNEVKVRVSTFILGQSSNHLSSVACQKNYFLHYILTGTFGQYLPHYARESNFELIKQRVNRLEVVNGYVEEAFAKYANFNKFNLSNIFEYMDLDSFKTVTENLVTNGAAKARYIYWNLMVPRRMSELTPELQYNKSVSDSLTEKDKCFFYGNIILDTKS